MTINTKHCAKLYFEKQRINWKRLTSQSRHSIKLRFKIKNTKQLYNKNKRKQFIYLLKSEVGLFDNKDKSK